MIRPDDFTFICALVRRRAGIVVEPGTEYHVESRMIELATAAGYGSVEKLVDAVRATPFALDGEVVDAMTTNETSFFRERKCFDELRSHIFPDLIREGGAARTIHIWSAATSSGQEAYTLAMVAAGFYVRILATDLSESMIRRASAGYYTQMEVNRGLPALMLVKYFRQVATKWLVSDELKTLIEWKRLNLIEPWTVPPTDVVLLRNVLIYFDAPTRNAIFEKLARTIRPGGYLALGASEAGIDPGDAFERMTSRALSPNWFQRKVALP